MSDPVAVTLRSLRLMSRALAVDIMATPAADRATLDRLTAAGRLVGQAAENLTRADEIVEQIIDGGAR